MAKASAAWTELPYPPRIGRGVVLFSPSNGGQALMQRSGSVSKTRQSRRRISGLTTAVAVHALALAAMLPIARPSLQDRALSSDPDSPVTVVQLVHPRPPAQAPPTTLQPEDSPKSRPVSLPQAPESFEVALVDPEASGPSAPARSEDDDPLYRAPFRTAAGQASARLRAGLACAHVDLDQLPKAVFDLCQAAAGLREAVRPRGPLG
jgi:hypothetical protein